MRIKLDENLPLSLRNALGNLGHDVEHVHYENLSGVDDPEVWQAAQRESRFLITQDLRSIGTSFGAGERHSGLLLVRLKPPGAGALLAKIRSVFESEDVESWSGALVVLTDRKLRVRRTQ